MSLTRLVDRLVGMFVAGVVTFVLMIVFGAAIAFVCEVLGV